MDDKDEGAVRIATLMLVLFVSVSTVLGLVLPDKNASYPHAMAMLADFVAAVVPSIDGLRPRLFLSRRDQDVPCRAVAVTAATCGAYQDGPGLDQAEPKNLAKIFPLQGWPADHRYSAAGRSSLQLPISSRSP
jgi:hypothetical protein